LKRFDRAGYALLRQLSRPDRHLLAGELIARHLDLALGVLRVSDPDICA